MTRNRTAEPVRIAAPYWTCAALALGASATANAEDAWGGSLAAVSDYVYRGISQTRGAPALQAGAHRRLGDRWSAGVWTSPVDFGDWIDARYELNATLTRAWPFGERWLAQTSYTRYIYPGEHGDYDYDEWLASLTYADRVTATIAFSPNVSVYGSGTAWREESTSEQSISYELTLLQPIGGFWSFSAGAGHQDLSDAFGSRYWFWSVGVAFCWESLQVDVLRIDTDSTARRLFGEQRAGGRWSAALIWKF